MKLTVKELSGKKMVMDVEGSLKVYDASHFIHCCIYQSMEHHHKY